MPLTLPTRIGASACSTEVSTTMQVPRAKSLLQHLQELLGFIFSLTYHKIGKAVPTVCYIFNSWISKVNTKITLISLI